MTICFTPAAAHLTDAAHHGDAARGNVAASDRAIAALQQVLASQADHDKILLRAAAGAGKSVALVRMVATALEHPKCHRVAVTAFANKQVFPLAGSLGTELGAATVCLFVSKDRLDDIPDHVLSAVTVATGLDDIPDTARVVLGTSHKLGAMYYRTRWSQLGSVANGDRPFDVLFVDEAWQLPLHRYATVEKLAPLSVGVGDVGQLPPIDPSENPWRGDPGYNPYRAWPTAFEALDSTVTIDLPAVWRPTAAQLPLWRAFYSDWDRLDCVAGPGDRRIDLPPLDGAVRTVWEAVATGAPTLLEIDGLPDAEAPDIDQPLLDELERLLEPLLAGGFSAISARHDGAWQPAGEKVIDSADPGDDPLIVILATRNQAVDDAAEMVERLTTRLDLPEGVLRASTVDSWQGQTNAITIAIHPLSGADKLDDFNSAFGRLAVTCTRATHGLLMLARSGLDQLLDDAAAQPGTPLGEPGTRSLPRQTHQRILNTFNRAALQLQP
ncbi:hypothetical protein SAMN05216207_101545 [Pseudonocardia ammonioxydans]|uniref:AAA domain-containing protein n=1 Tax=Pseudonocardia ammonioxydans TaxID=260086 RepID=A0A1I4ZFG2_PSUAM|nr:hypothetical protein [Pseudonocardia ammonioxydans]SFN48783.1 hypothetical protein SAMN05216207_101545 [Pseudonocardia ammonioxydans]